MNFKKQLCERINDFEEKSGNRPLKIKLTSKNIMDIEPKDVSSEIMEIIIGKNHNDLIGNKIFGLEIVNINADKLKVL